MTVAIKHRRTGEALHTYSGDSLRGANLRDANLGGANLGGAYLRDAFLDPDHIQHLPPFQIPQQGTLTVWKALAGGVCKLQIPASAKRTASVIGRKCRAERAKVLAIWDREGKRITESVDRHSGRLTYRVGEVVEPDSYDDNPLVECTHGIHFFLTREEAEAWL